MTMAEIIYKICSQNLWQQAQALGQFEGAPVDLADGYIHFSTAEQVIETAMKHFKDQKDLVLLSVSVAALEACPAELKWEPSRGGALFPHLYGPMPLEAVTKCQELALLETGYHQFPAELAQ
ncbi:MAG: DUF952 domain-containing protein [Cohaesibacter sp.]|jgi:uncharacterized protein (DUF952 family)|nr:DUF952 domain-containing protein [Cohaesibacter sp.]